MMGTKKILLTLFKNGYKIGDSSYYYKMYGYFFLDKLNNSIKVGCAQKFNSEKVHHIFYINGNYVNEYKMLGKIKRKEL